MSKTYTKSEIATLLMTNDKAVGRALVALNERQTYFEQAAQATLYSNGVGFSGADARIGMSMASFFLKFGYLSAKQIAFWRKPNKRGTPRIVKYAGQLLEVANSKAA